MKNSTLLLILISMITSCNSNLKSAKLTETFKSDTLHFSINYPKNWVALQNPKELNTIAIVEDREDSNDTYQENMVCWVEEMPIQISDSVFFHASVTQLKISNPALQIEKLGAAKLGENKFSAFTFDFSAKDNAKYKVTGYCLVHEKFGYNFACTSTQIDYKRHHEIFKSILSTFKPL